MKTKPTISTMNKPVMLVIMVSLLILTYLYLVNFNYFRSYINAHLGSKTAMLELGYHYERPRRNWSYEESDYWYVRAAKKGSLIGMSMCNRSNRSIWGQTEEGRQWLIKRGEAGDVGAVLILSNNYLYGYGGFKPDPEQTKYWNNKLSEVGKQKWQQYNLQLDLENEEWIRIQRTEYPNKD